MSVNNTPFYKLSVPAFAEKMLSKKVCFGIIVFYANGGFETNHQALNEFAIEILKFADFDRHEAFIFQIDKDRKFLLATGLHSTLRGPAKSRVQTMNPERMGDLLKNCLKKSKTETFANAVAGTWIGGGYTVICPFDNLHPEVAELMKETISYELFLSRINTVFGPALNDNLLIDPVMQGQIAELSSEATLKAILAAGEFVNGHKDIGGLTFNIQGLDPIAILLAKKLLDKGACINVWDRRKEYELKELVKYGPTGKVQGFANVFAMYTERSDFFVPCVGAGSLNAKTIKMLNTRFIVGPAENQLCDPELDGKKLAQTPIIYVPEPFYCRVPAYYNAGWIFGEDKIEPRLLMEGIFDETLGVLQRSAEENIMPTALVKEIIEARSMIRQPNSLYRGDQELAQLLAKYTRFSTC